MRWDGNRLFNDLDVVAGDVRPCPRDGENGWEAEWVAVDGEVLSSAWFSKRSSAASWLQSEVQFGGGVTETWGRWVRAERAKLGWSQNKLARSAMVDRSTIKDLEAGNRAPSIRTKSLVEEALRNAATGKDEEIRSLRDRIEKLERWADGVRAGHPTACCAWPPSSLP
jgi:transcriptional regulator with XRE-family HTH domain